MAITENTIKELKNLKDYCNHTSCNECIFYNFADKSCFFWNFPHLYDIKEIAQKFLIMQ